MSQGVTAQDSSETLPRKIPSEDDVLETMVSTSDQRPAGKQSEERYWGQFSGLSLLQRMRKLCGSVAGLHQSQDGESCEDDFADAFDSALPPQGSPGGWDAFALLPSEKRLSQCIDVALNDGCCLLKFVDRSSIDELVRHIYDTDSFEYTPQDRKSLALIFSILAVGRRFENDNNESDAQKRRNNISKGSVKCNWHGVLVTNDTQIAILSSCKEYAGCRRLSRYCLPADCTFPGDIPAGELDALNLLFIYMRWCGRSVTDGTSLAKLPGRAPARTTTGQALHFRCAQHNGHLCYHRSGSA